ncbi:unnamed protein product [Arctia plantaginis]|uniref:Carboxylesterase type B domain-containing protein n=1 Tax=Arctia plantaginis TaxID=874455 RepID=A0A8S0YPY3_ARCPL|nr:unnamed protein product [Arctia plantaginis]
MLNAINSSCCIFLILQNDTSLHNKNVIIDVGEGTIKGLKAPDGEYYMYLGIPYAKVDESNYFGSGSAQALTVLHDPDKLAPLKMARYIGLETDDIEKAVSYLSTVKTNLVINAAAKLNIQFKPCVETLFDDVEPFIENSWIDAKVPKVKNMSIIIGFTNLEMAPLYTQDEKYFNNLSILNKSLAQVFDKEKIRDSKDIIAHFYFGDEKIGSNVKWDIIRFASDFTYIHPIHRTLKKYLENGAGPIYFYMFSYVGSRNTVVTSSYDELDSSRLCCASHNDDLDYLFSIQNKPALTEADTLTMQRMTRMWTNFAKYSNPTPVINEVLPVLWEPVTKNTYIYLNIDTKLALGKRPLHRRMAFWDLFYDHKKLSQTSYEDD